MKRSFGFSFFAVLCTLCLSCSNMIGEYAGTVKPTGAFLINNGDDRTVSRSVTLAMSVTDAVEMRFSNDEADWSAWEPFASSKEWELEPGPQKKTVYGEFKGDAGSVLKVNDEINPFIREKFVAFDGISNDYLGGTIAGDGTGLSISNDGTAVVVACPHDNSKQGSAYLYQWNGMSWDYTFLYDDINGAADDYFAWSVAISGDGKRIAVGAMLDHSPLEDQGSVYLYSYNGNTWEKTHFTAYDARSIDHYGVSVSLSSNGTTFVVGSYRSGIPLNPTAHCGSVYIYTQSGSIWNGKKITASNIAPQDYFGWHAAISGDAKTVVVGSPNAKIGGIQTGTAYLYKLIDSEWIETKIIGSILSSGAYFGRYVSVTHDGETVAIAAPRNTIDGGKSQQGSVHVFKWNGMDWNESIITDSNGSASDWFGYSVSLSGDGQQMLVGSRNKTVEGKGYQGSVFLYIWDGIGWNEESYIYDPFGLAGDMFGYTVSISGDGSTYGVTAPRADIDGKVDQGAFYLY